MNRLLLKSQKKTIFDIVVIVGLEPANFKWTKERDYSGRGEVPCLRYEGTDFFFKFDFKDKDRYCVFSPGEQEMIEAEFPEDWDDVAFYIKQWLDNLTREIRVVDPWEALGKYTPGEKIDLNDEKANTPFTYPEVESITKAINRLHDEINKNYKLSSKEIEIVENRLDYLIDRAKNVGRIDWKNIFIATMMNVAFQLAMNPTQTSLLWNLIKNCFRGILLLSSR